MKSQSIKWNPVVFNVAFWLAYFLYEWLAKASVYNEYRRYLYDAAVLVPLTALASVFTVHFLFGMLHQKGRKTAFWAGLLLSMILFSMLRRGFHYYWYYPLYYPDGQAMPFLFLPKLIIEGVNIYLFVGLYSMFHFIRAWYEKDRLAAGLRQQKTQAELSLLKNQVEPHFIFNTLNNIYSFAVQKDERTADLVYQLSSFLNFSLYESKPDLIAFEKEMEVIHAYIELEKVRFGNRLDVSVNIYDRPDGILIPPLILLPLVENSFKHGLSPSIEQCWLRIDVSRPGRDLLIKIENSFSEEEGPEEGPKERPGEKNGNNNGGLGLENVKRRLEIVYPGKHELRTEAGSDSFLLVLKIEDAHAPLYDRG